MDFRFSGLIKWSFEYQKIDKNWIPKLKNESEIKKWSYKLLLPGVESFWGSPLGGRY